MSTPVCNDATTTRSQLVSPARLHEFFAPRSVAIVGASDTSGWAANVVDSLRASSFDGRLEYVHPRHETVFGQRAKKSLTQLDEPVDLAYVLAPTHAVEDVVDDAAVVGVRNLVVVAADYAEAGAEGKERERRLVEQARSKGIVLLGPNCLGFINASANVAPYGLQIAPPLISGPIGVVLQSGALASAVLGFARAHATGVSLLTSMGNESMITTTDVIEYLIDDEDTKVIALFLESIRQPDRFRALATRALDVGKPIVALKVGRSPIGQQTALAHTGAIAGDDAVVDAALRQHGVVRVDSLEELLVTAGMMGYCKVPVGRRMGVVTASGGACDIIADRAAEEGIELPDFAAGTVQALEGLLPPIATAKNPLDVTGFGLAHARSGATTIIDNALATVLEDPGLDFVLFLGLNLPESPPAETQGLIDQRVAAVADIIHEACIPVIPAASTCTDVGPYARDVLSRHALHLAGGIELGMTALGHALRWSDQRRLPKPRSAQPRNSLRLPDWVDRTDGSWSEARARELLTSARVPMVPAELVTSAADAVAAADLLGYPVVLKICSAQIVHKSDVGGVALGLTDAQDVRDAYARISKVADAMPDVHVEGVLVSPMRTGGMELLAGVTVDPTFGPVFALGLGGIWVEVLRDTSLRLLPVDESDVREMLDELRGAALLRGVRGGQPVDLDKLAAIAIRIASCAEALGPSLQALEVNPLWVDGSDVEALDVLVATNRARSAA